MFETDDVGGGADYTGGRLATDDAYSRMPEPKERKQEERHELDSEPANRFHRRLLSIYEQELDRQAENRMEMATDADFYDNIQWSEEDARELKERGQDPLVFNVISSSVNWVTGTEKRGRTDYKILPRKKEAAKPAEKKTQLMKYLSDVNRTPFHMSRGFEDAAKVGLGWIECGVQEEDDSEPIYDRYESWRNLLWDSACSEKDLSDCRYMFRSKWLDMDVAEAMFGQRKGVLKSSAGDGDNYGLDQQGDEAMDSAENSRELSGGSRTDYSSDARTRVRVIEAWIRRPTKVSRIKGGEFAGDVYEPGHAGHEDALEGGKSVLVEKVSMRMYVAIFASSGLLYAGISPYRHNTFPFTPIWCYRRDRDGLPYGMIRGMRDLQYDINKRAAKALHILSTNKVIMDEGAVEDIDEFLEEISRPDAVIVKKQGKELVINADRDVAPVHMEFMSRSISMIQQQSGVTDESMGRSTNATSGIAIGRRQEQGAMATAGIFDNLRFASQVHGEKKLSLIEQYMGEEKQFRITNMRGTPDYITVNDGLPENDIVHTKADFVISESDWRATIRQNATEELTALLMQLAPAAPQLAMVMIDLVVEEMDIGNREELVKRIRQVTGMKDPDQTEPTPEELAAEKAQQAQAEQMEQERQAMLQAELEGKAATTRKDDAAAQKAIAESQVVLNKLSGMNVETLRTALEAALAMIGNPAVSPVADVVLKEAGFVSATEQAAIDEQNAIEQQAMEQQAIEEQALADEEQAAQMMQQQPDAAQQAQPQLG